HTDCRSYAHGSRSTRSRRFQGDSVIDRKGCACDGSEPASRESDDAAGGLRGIVYAAADVFSALGILRSAGSDAGRNRTLRNIGVPVGTTNLRNRSQDGSWSASVAGLANAGAGEFASDRDWSGVR